MSQHRLHIFLKLCSKYQSVFKPMKLTPMGVIILILSDTSNVERDIVCHTLPLADIGRCFCAVRNIYLFVNERRPIDYWIA